MATQSNDKTQTSVTLFLDVLHRIQRVDPEFPIQYAICLAEVSQDEGCSVTALAKKTGLALSTVSRIVGALSEYRQRGEPYGFLEVKISPNERRKKELYMTSQGRAALKDFISPFGKVA